MTAAEQDLTLFFKLYLLARKQNYVNYMADTRVLARWFDFSQHKTIKYYDKETSIICANCFNILAKIYGGAITLQCNRCHGQSNMAYEIQQLHFITGLPWALCIYLLVRAVEDIYKCNNTDVMQKLLF